MSLDPASKPPPSDQDASAGIGGVPDPTASAEDPPALEASYREMLRTITTLLRKSFGSGPPDPEDIAQQAYRKLLERKRLDDIGNLEAFLWRTARNLVFKDYRAKAVRSRYDYELEQLYFPSRGCDLDPERVGIAKEQVNQVRQVLLAMPERRRRAFVLHRIEGLSIAETGRRLKISATAAAKHIARAMASIDQRLSDYHD
ncbi:MAG: sigma-70 family RNA polymerase sigma factor [Pseudomonadota bacterium]